MVLPAYLLALGHGELEVGLISTATLFGSAFTTLAIGRWGNRFPVRRLMLAAALLMAATGAAFAGFSSLWPLLVVGFAGTLNPSSGDASVFMPLDHTMLATAPAEQRTALFARYSFFGSVFGALGALAAGVPEWLAAAGWSMLDALRAMFLLYGADRRRSLASLPRACPSRASSSKRRPLPSGLRAASSCGWRACSASTPSPAAWCSTHCSRSGCSSASA